jgi:hypothetical protein|tara:strand:+ start:244 stop:531 length:288 start_codon:yes stop_codon:yes gene_type:complete
MAKYVWKTCFVALITMIAIAEIGEHLTGTHIPWVMRLSLVLGITVGMSFLKSTLNLVTALEEEKPLAGTVRNTLGPDRAPAAPTPKPSVENDERT